ncbi:MAG TPA: TonB-dependent receptor [Gemmatimonadaceae bacterium]|nr:TonB-dependent receptor [Gemmatimonadaceae bacterium]
MTAAARPIGAICAVLFLVGTRLNLASAATTTSSPAALPLGEIRGRLVDAASGQAILAGSITVLRASDSVAIKSVNSGTNGSFRIDGLGTGRYVVRLRALGFAPVVRTDVTILAEHLVVDLGAIALSALPAAISGQVVTAAREDVTLSPDRNSYSTKNMTTASGGTAVDVLRNVPSVEVDASNQVSLRGNQSVVVQINGRSSPLKGEQLGNFLAQLPASAVKKVEVSTNPSAKNDPEGTAGIINIVLNQDTDIGWSGGLTAATGTTGQANASANVGHQAGPLTLFLSYGLYRNHQVLDGHSQLTNLAIPPTVPAFVMARINGSQDPLWQNSTFRGEYRFTPHDALSLDGTISGGTFDRNNVSHSTDRDEDGDVIGLFNQSNVQSDHYFTQDYDLAYRRTGEANQRTFSSEFRLTEAIGRANTNLFGDVQQGTAATGAESIPREHDLSTGAWPTWTLQTDYTEPFGGRTGTKLETGFKEIGRHTNNDFSAAYLDSATNIFVPVSARATSFDYREQIGSAYAVFTQQIHKLQAQAGLRLETATNRLALPNGPVDQREFDNHYASVFPSAILSYDVTTTQQAKLSYSRRINRPNPFQLDPVEFRQDARSIFRGNAGLRPEYTDAFELGLQQTGGWGTVQLNPYLRNTAHAVRFIQSVDSTGTSLSTFDNVASTQEMGTELNVTYHPGPLTLLTGGSASHYSSNAANLPGNPSTRAFLWSARVNATWKFSPTLDVQLMTNYRAPFETEGGSRTAFVFMNVALRRKLWSDQGSLTLRVQDPFNWLTFGSVTTNPEATQSTVQSFGIRGVIIAFSRNFGQAVKLSPKETQGDPPTPTPPGVR